MLYRVDYLVLFAGKPGTIQPIPYLSTSNTPEPPSA
jgi:hypothetical protein